MEPKLDVLLSLIKFDMEQIRYYGQAILNISSISILASFAISAFVHSKENPSALYKKRIAILLITHIGIIALLAAPLYFYCYGLHLSRAVLEIREQSLKAYLYDQNAITLTALYPDEASIEKNVNRMDLWLERFPIIVSIGFLFVKACIESLWFWRIAKKDPNPLLH